VRGWLMKGHVMSVSGLAELDKRKVVRAWSVACGHEIGRLDEMWLREKGDVGHGRTTRAYWEEA